MAYFMEKVKTKSTPYVLIDEAKQYMKLEGDCFPDDTLEFFWDINKWLCEYLESGNYDKLTFDFELNYFNSSASKILFDMLEQMNEFSKNGKQAQVNWHVESGDSLLRELYEDFEEDFTDLKIILIEK
ncbi:MAG: DUF1987 domain-containing protein [Lachnospiraceae bacterium]|nr:DUF1987 domain-containing protein [Lachnospiraceae bacterium]